MTDQPPPYKIIFRRDGEEPLVLLPEVGEDAMGILMALLDDLEHLCLGDRIEVVPA